MEILIGLGVNETLWFQLVVFLATVFFLTAVVFNPYMKAYSQRMEKTISGEDLVKTLVMETQDLQFKYEHKAREINEKVRGLFDKHRADAYLRQNELVSKARNETAALLKSNREKIARQIQESGPILEREIPAVSQAIATRLLGKEING